MGAVPINRFDTVVLEAGNVIDFVGTVVGMVAMLDSSGAPVQSYQIAQNNIIGPFATVTRWRIDATNTQPVNFTVRNNLASEVDTIRTIETATYTPQLSDNGKLLRFTGSCVVTLTPSYPTGWNCLLRQVGAGTVSFSGATVRSLDGATALAGQYANGYLALDLSGEYYLGGDVA